MNGGFSRVLTLGTPGVAAESNGGFHPLGEHAEVSFSVDGQPSSDQQSRTFSNQVSLNTAESIDVINGAPPAEFGDKTSMIGRAVTRSGLGAGSPTGTVSLGYDTFGTGTTDLSLRAGDSKVGNFFAADAVNSQRSLDPPEFVPLHANGNAENLFERFDLQPTPADSLHLNLSISRSWFQTPNTYDQQQSRQDQRQLMRSGNFAVAYSHVFSLSWLLDANLWWRGDLADYYASRNLFAASAHHALTDTVTEELRGESRCFFLEGAPQPQDGGHGSMDSGRCARARLDSQKSRPVQRDG